MKYRGMGSRQKSNSNRLLCLGLSILLLATTAQSESIDVVSFNLESGAADIDILSDQVEDFEGIDIWGFSEVSASWRNALVNAASTGESASFDGELSEEGGGDRLLIVYNSDRFTLLETQELDDLNPQGRVRSPLFVRLRDSQNGDQEFIFMVNHLYRSDAGARHAQATGLNEWASNQTAPIINVGDFNFDWSVQDGDNDHDAGYDNLVADDVFEWVRPDELIRTQCNPNFDSVLDFVFVAHDAQDWAASSDIVPMDPGYCDNYQSNNNDSDHRPLRAVIDPATDMSDTIEGEELPTPPPFMFVPDHSSGIWRYNTSTGELIYCIGITEDSIPRIICSDPTSP